MVLGLAGLTEGTKPAALSPSGTDGARTAAMQDDPWREWPPIAAQKTEPPQQAAPREQKAKAAKGAIALGKLLRASPDTAGQIGAVLMRGAEIAARAEPQLGLPKLPMQMTPGFGVPNARARRECGGAIWVTDVRSNTLVGQRAEDVFRGVMTNCHATPIIWADTSLES